MTKRPAEEASEPEKPLESQLLDWIRTEGYPFEMQVARSLRGEANEIIQSVFYTDPTSNNPREIDVVSRFWMPFAQGSGLIELVIECKGDTKPWVLLSSGPHGFDLATLSQSHVATKPAWEMLMRLREEPEIGESSILRPALLAHGVVQGLKTKNQDVAYDAMRGVISAAVARVAETGEGSSIQPYFDLHLPVIVINARLFQYSVDERGDDHLEEVSRGHLISRNRIGGRKRTIVHVVPFAELPAFAKEVAALARAFGTLGSDFSAQLQARWDAKRRGSEQATPDASQSPLVVSHRHHPPPPPP